MYTDSTDSRHSVRQRSTSNPRRFSNSSTRAPVFPRIANRLSRDLRHDSLSRCCIAPRENVFPVGKATRSVPECQRSTIPLDFCPGHLSYVKVGTKYRKSARTHLRDNRCILLSYVSARQYRRYDVPLPLISLLEVVARFTNQPAGLLSDGTSETIVHSRGKECGNLPVPVEVLRSLARKSLVDVKFVNTVCKRRCQKYVVAHVRHSDCLPYNHTRRGQMRKFVRDC